MNEILLDEVIILQKKLHEDLRGFFFEFYNKKEIKKKIKIEFVQDNISFSKIKGTIRGLHLQKNPNMQAKLIQVLKGSIQDIIVDVRKDSKTFGKYMSVILRDFENKQVYIPEGFAHGFLTLEKETLVIYKTSNYYNKESEITIKWNDDALAIKWMIDNNKIITSLKDSNGILLSQF